MTHPLLVATDTDKAVPAGWYTACASHDLPAGNLLSFQLAGLSLVAWRGESGHVAIIDKRCPHMGGDLSRGNISGNSIRCPVHRFTFDSQGHCTGTGYAGVKSHACTSPWPVLEINGLVLVYYHPRGDKPDWHPKAYDWQGWSDQVFHDCKLPATAQLITEGIADKGHLTTTHGYSDVSLDKPFATDGAFLTTAYSFTNSGSLPGAGKLMLWLGSLLPLQMRVQFHYEAYGLGYSFTEVLIPRLNIRMRHFVNPTPIDHKTVKLFYSMALGPVKPGAIHPLLKPIPETLLQKILFPILHKGFMHDMQDDIAMWSQMQAVKNPRLCKADGPVNKFRRWAGQFYSG